MNPGKTIAIIGLSALENLGLKSLIRELSDIAVETFGSFPEFFPLSDRADAYVVNPPVFVENIDFFLPKRQKTLVVKAGADEAEVTASVSRLVDGLEGKGNQTEELSSREIEVLRLIAEGKINKEIADKLCISVNTVITHRKNISSKLNIKSAQGLSLYALMNGLI